MLNDNYLEKILGEQYNMSDYFEKINNDNEIDIEQMQIGDNNDNISQINDNYDLSNNSNNKDNKNKNGENEQNNKKNEEKKSKKNASLIDKNETENALDKKVIKTSSKQTKNDDKTINDLKKLYPDIHKVLEPIVNLLIKNYSDKKADENLVKLLTDKIYYAVESTNNDDTVKANAIQNNKDKKGIKNGLLYDLIKILVLNKLID